MFMPVTLTILCLQFFNLIAHALPLEPRIVFNPHITVPNEQTAWKVGSQETVTWDPTGLPDETLTGQAVLGFLEGDSPNEHLMLDNPLAKGFLLKDGQVQITVPDVPERDSYIVVVFGDSGNASPRFAITGGNATSSSASPSTVPSSTIVASSTSATIVPPITTSGTVIPTANPTSTDITLTVTTGTSPPSTVATVTSSGSAPIVTVPSSAPLSSAASGSIIAASTVTDTADSQGTSAPANAPSNGAMRTSIELIYSVIAATTILLFTVA